MAINRAKLLAFIRTMLDVESEVGDVQLMVLKFFGTNVPKDIKDSVIKPWVVRRPNSKKLLVSPDDLATEVNDLCEENAEAVGGLVRFRLYAYAGQGNQACIGATLLKIFKPLESDIDNESGGQSITGEDATPKGLITQMMRHNEQMFRMYSEGINVTQTKLQNENEDIRSKLDVVLGKVLTLVQVTENAMSQAHLRNLATEDAQAKRAIINKGGDLIMQYLPMFAMKYMGGAYPAGQPNPELDMLRAFFKSVRPEQLFGMLPIFDEDQKGVIITFYNKLLDEEEQQKAAAAAKLTGAMPSPKQMTEGQKAAAE